MKRISKNHVKFIAITVFLAVIAINMPINFQIGEVSFVIGNRTFPYFFLNVLNLFLRVTVIYHTIILVYYVLCKFTEISFRNIYRKNCNIILSVVIYVLHTILTVKSGDELNLYFGEYIWIFGYPDEFLTFYSPSFWNQFCRFGEMNLFNYFSFDPIQLFVNLAMFYFIISINAYIVSEIKNKYSKHTSKT